MVYGQPLQVLNRKELALSQYPRDRDLSKYLPSLKNKIFTAVKNATFKKNPMQEKTSIIPKGRAF